ncbi:hypothetical protein SAMN02745225_01412 [Ferrithrix thermotolerans DSM 19514]|uniref:Uncharacterized protein n=1 Tax=Ferrithrix thermotolerans DSM 19514 TaxID=1121881 RepID=A0A1M4VRJ3_9ACTN|nr:hypothetical protein SAMN02745225_01412 [Ferrithrix thermotolerans DSM 19514]
MHYRSLSVELHSSLGLARLTRSLSWLADLIVTSGRIFVTQESIVARALDFEIIVLLSLRC